MFKTCTFKVAIIGDSGVGKTSIIERLTRETYYAKKEVTIGAAFRTHTLNVVSQIVKLQIWDTAGQERYNALVPMYIRDADAVIMVFDITNGQTLKRIKDVWLDMIRKYEVAKCQYYIVGNKKDISDIKNNVKIKMEVNEYIESERVKKQMAPASEKPSLQIKKICRANKNKLLLRQLQDSRDADLQFRQGEMKYYETSAKSGEGVREMFEEITRELLKDKEIMERRQLSTENFRIEEISKDEGRCCEYW